MKRRDWAWCEKKTYWARALESYLWRPRIGCWPRTAPYCHVREAYWGQIKMQGLCWERLESIVKNLHVLMTSCFEELAHWPWISSWINSMTDWVGTNLQIIEDSGALLLPVHIAISCISLHRFQGQDEQRKNVFWPRQIDSDFASYEQFTYFQSSILCMGLLV